LRFNNPSNLNYLPDKLGVFFPKLVTFHASGCSLKSIKRSNFKSMDQLRELHLNGNQIKELEEEIFNDLLNLTTLSIGTNQIQILQPKLLYNLKNLNYVGFYSNPIENLPADLFINNKELSSIIFQDNRLKTIGVDFTKFKYIEFLNLNGNTCIDVFFSDSKTNNISAVQHSIDRNCTANPKAA